jgi:hypothetical protein
MQSQPGSGGTQSPPSSPGWPPDWTGRKRRSRSFVFPLLFVIVGVVLLLNNLGYLPWSIWTALGQMWPVLLILFGLDLLVGRRNTWVGATVILIAFVAVLGAALWLTYSDAKVSSEPVAAYPHQPATVPLSGATSGDVTLQFGAGALRVSALPSDSTDLAEATAALPPGMRLVQKDVRNVGAANVQLSTEGGGPVSWPFGGFGRNPGDVTLDTQLARKIPLNLQADVGAGQSDFDLKDLAVRSFVLHTGAGQATVHFPAQAGQTTADIHSGAGQIILDVPAGVGASIHGNNGLVSVNVSNDRFQKVGDGYQTSDYDKAANRVDVTLNLGVGEVDVR